MHHLFWHTEASLPWLLFFWSLSQTNIFPPGKNGPDQQHGQEAKDFVPFLCHMFTYSADQELSFPDEPPLVKCLPSCTNVRREPGFSSQNPHKKAGHSDTQQSWGSRDKTGPWALLASQHSLSSKVRVSVRSGLKVQKKGTAPGEWHQRCPLPPYSYICAPVDTHVSVHTWTHTHAQNLFSFWSVALKWLPADICTAKSQSK